MVQIGLLNALILILLQLCTWGTQKQNSMDFTKDRQRMVSEQIIARGIHDSKVISAMQNVERHLFVPKYLQNLAYEDRPLPIGYSQTISQPYIVALMSELLEVHSQDKILEIGTGSGYQAAILAKMTNQVYSIEIVPKLADRATKILDSLELDNVHVKCADGYLGWPDQAPFDGIIVSCSPTDIPPALIDQLKEGGKLVIPIGKKDVKKLVLLSKEKGKIIQKNVIPVRFVPMLDEDGNAY